MSSSTRAFRPSHRLSRRGSAAGLSLALSLGLTGAAMFSASPALYAQSARSDLDIQSDVLKALASYPDLSGEHITATAKNGIVTLAGTASSDTAKTQAQVVSATVDGVDVIINSITVNAGAQPTTAQSDSEDPADRNQAQPEDPVQQAQSTDPNQQQAPYTPQSQPQPGTTGDWGQAGPPPDVQNGQIPQQPQENQQPQQSQQPQENQYPMQDPGQDEAGAPPPQQQSRPSYGQYPPQRPQYQSRPYAPPNLSSTPLTIRPGTIFTIRTSEPLDSHLLRGGERFHATVAQDMFQGQYLAIPRGAVLTGEVIGVKKPGDLKGSAGFALRITSMTLGGQTYPISTDTFATDTRGKGGYTTANTVGGAAIGAIIGAIAGGGPGAAIGAVAGGTVGLGASAASGGPRSVMPPETPLTFHLEAPLTVYPISLAEVQQLQASVAPPRRPMRPPPPYPYGYYPPPPPPPPPPYYYPYRY